MFRNLKNVDGIMFYLDSTIYFLKFFSHIYLIGIYIIRLLGDTNDEKSTYIYYHIPI